MNLYMIQYDGQEDYVEAGNMGAAVEIWERAGKADRDFDGTEQPESVALVHDAAVLRAPASLARQTIEGEPVYLDAWPLRDAVRRLVEAADHLFDVHDCDHHGYEELICARDAAKEWLSASHPEVARRTIEGPPRPTFDASRERDFDSEHASMWPFDGYSVDDMKSLAYYFRADRNALANDVLTLRALVHSQAATLEGYRATAMEDQRALREQVAGLAATIQALQASPVPRAGESANDGL